MKWFFVFLTVLVVFGFTLGYQLMPRIPSGSFVPANGGIGRAEVNEKPGIPIGIQIPKINVDSNVEQVGLDAEGNMGVPKVAANTAWYNLGPRPGVKGSAVISGHLDTAAGKPAVFWSLKNLRPGDEIVVMDDKSKRYTFFVVDERVYQFDKVPLKEIFGAAGAKRLNLITCGGEWNKFTSNYSERVVVFAKMK